jgi:hypothetical protein
VAIRRRPHQGRLTLLESGINFGAMRQQRLHGSQPAGPRGGHERRFTTAKGEVGISTGIEQRLHDCVAAVGAGERQGGDAVAVLHIRIRLGGQQARNDRGLVMMRRPVQRRHAVNLGLIHVAVAEQGPNGGEVLAFHRVGERRLGRRAVEHGNRNGQQPDSVTEPAQDHPRTN